MKIKFAPVPRVAIIFYVLGFAVLLPAVWNISANYEWLPAWAVAAGLPVGAMLVCIGSAINIWHQFRPSSKRRSEP